ncbi:MAG: OmpA family protein [Calditrichaeota bacterium]|nr:MAG: OmpA family protein [Calditrichota bacterium]
MKKPWMFIILALVISSGSITGQTWYKSFGAGGNFSVFKLWGGEVDRSSLSYTLGLDARYGLHPSIMAGLDVSYGMFKPAKSGTSAEANKLSPYRTFVTPVNLTVRLTPLPSNIVKPYGLVGLGLLFWNLKETGAKDGNILNNGKLSWGESVHGLQVNLGLTIGAGFEWFVAQNVALDFEGRGSFLPGSKLDNVGEGDANNKYYDMRVGAVYYWGSEGDKDGDGIPDKDDLDPLRPEDFDNFQDSDGAPDHDNDNDGVLDEWDGAPNTPEDKDGYRDDDGIPDPDNDGDGIADGNDRAPNEPEDFDGIADEDGAPETDYDNDGIVDTVDQCPQEPETKNGYLDDDGCPDTPPVIEQAPIIPEQQGKTLILQGVNFEYNSADLNAEARMNLGQVAQSLIANPNARVLIVGHTDNTGSADFNLRLSFERAEAVKLYLIAMGVSEDRMMTEGRGSSEPVASNATEEGRSQNRRIEFIRLE